MKNTKKKDEHNKMRTFSNYFLHILFFSLFSFFCLALTILAQQNICWRMLFLQTCFEYFYNFYTSLSLYHTSNTYFPPIFIFIILYWHFIFVFIIEKLFIHDRCWEFLFNLDLIILYLMNGFLYVWDYI